VNDGAEDILLGKREQSAHHRFDLRPRERDRGKLGQWLVGQSLSQASDRSDQCSTKVIVGTVSTLQETAGPSEVQRIAFASEKVPFDLFVDDGLGISHLCSLAPHGSRSCKREVTFVEKYHLARSPILSIEAFMPSPLAARNGYAVDMGSGRGLARCPVGLA
jgi:hypothetical protein